MRDSDIRALLTDRQLIILQMVANGSTNWGVKQKLKVSMTVVKSDLQHVYEILDVLGRTHAVAEGIRGGLIV